MIYPEIHGLQFLIETSSPSGRLLVCRALHCLSGLGRADCLRVVAATGGAFVGYWGRVVVPAAGAEGRGRGRRREAPTNNATIATPAAPTMGNTQASTWACFHLDAKRRKNPFLVSQAPRLLNRNSKRLPPGEPLNGAR